MRGGSEARAIEQAKARYVRGVDTNEPALVRALLAEDCVLDDRDCFVDPTSGRDDLPAMSVVVHGRDAWRGGGLHHLGVVSVHQTYNFEIEISGDRAESICGMTDRLFRSEGADWRVLVGYGHYHESWRRAEAGWQLVSLRLTRLKIDARLE